MLGYFLWKTDHMNIMNIIPMKNQKTCFGKFFQLLYLKANTIAYQCICSTFLALPTYINGEYSVTLCTSRHLSFAVSSISQLQ